jgi:monovalent cation/proton antiporter MnhG/PhaG subunit
LEFLSNIDFATVRLYVSYAFLLFGVFDVLVGMIGLVRLPDIYNRLHATTKIATAGAFFVFILKAEMLCFKCRSTRTSSFP